MRLIGAEQTKEHVVRAIRGCRDSHIVIPAVLTAIDMTPTVCIDRKNGERLMVSRWEQPSAVCNLCGFDLKWVDRTNFCPNCGAWMRPSEHGDYHSIGGGEDAVQEL